MGASRRTRGGGCVWAVHIARKGRLVEACSRFAVVPVHLVENVAFFARIEVKGRACRASSASLGYKGPIPWLTGVLLSGP